jgi:tRNA A37 threonylcarbamoyltransferase TsaD
VATAKGIATARGLPLAPVDHLQGHVAANFLGDSFEPPFLCLIASGGHTFLARVEDHAGYTVLGATLDDAAGEAFDKGARLLDLPYPGGPALERLAAQGDPDAYDFPIAAGVPGLDFSSATSATRRSPDEQTSPPPTSARSSRRSPCASSAACGKSDPTHPCSAWRSAAASRPTGRCASVWRASASSSTSPSARCAPTTRR